jgi:hypothetical protein
MIVDIFLKVSKYISEEEKENIFKFVTNNYNMYKNEKYTDELAILGCYCCIRSNISELNNNSIIN